MRRLFAIAIALLLAGCSQVQGRPQPPANPDPGSTSTPVSTPPKPQEPVTAPVTEPPPGKHLKAIQFTDARHGWAAGDGVILATADAGQTWVKQYEGPAQVQQLQFVDDALHGWAVTGTELLRTTDGGRTWTTVENFKPTAVSFVTPDVGWAQSGAKLYRTADGSTTWQPATAPDNLKQICATGPQTAYATTGRALLHTADGGRSWQSQVTSPMPPGGPWPSLLQCRGNTAWVLFFGGVGMSHQAYAAFRTTDGGRTWQPQLASQIQTLQDLPGINAYAGPFDALDANRAFFLGSCAPCGGIGTSSITRTLDGGKTWQQDTIAYLRTVTALSFADDRHGWILAQTGQGSLIFATADGGRTWQPQYPATALEPAQAVVMVNDHTGYGLGTRGDPTVLLRTKDGGATWSRAHLPDGFGPVTGVAFTSATTGYIAAKEEWYFATTDGGTTWQETGGIDWTKATQGHKRQTADGPIISITFATPERGMAVTMDGRFIRTEDGGATWH